MNRKNKYTAFVVNIANVVLYRVPGKRKACAGYATRCRMEE